jgi:hypothetical protein
MVPRLRSGCDAYFIARAGSGVYTKSVYAAIYGCAKKSMCFTATKNRVIVHHDLLWPAAVAGIRSENGRNSLMSDFAIKTSAKALATSNMLRRRHGETISSMRSHAHYVVPQQTHRNTYSAIALSHNITQETTYTHN